MELFDTSVSGLDRKYIGCVLQHSGSWLHPVYTTLYLGTKGWTNDAHQAYRMTDAEAKRFKARGGIRVWTEPNISLTGTIAHV